VTNPLLGMNKVQKLGAAVLVLVLLFLPYLGFSLTSGKKAPARSSGMAVKQAPAPASGLNLTLIMVGIGVGAVVVAYSGWLWKLKEKQAANTAEQAQQLATYRLTFGKGGQATVKQVIAVLNKLHPIMAQGEQSRLQATAPIPQLVVLAHRNEGKCMYLRLPQGNRALETTVRAVLDSLGVQMTWLGGLPLAVPPLMGSKGKPRRVKFSYQLAKAAKDSPYPIKSDFGDDGNPLVTLAGMLKVSSEMPVAGILFDFRAGGREWLASSAGQVKKLREKQAKVVAGLRSQGSKELIKVLEEKQAKGTKRSFELGRVVLFAAGYK